MLAAKIKLVRDLVRGIFLSSSSCLRDYRPIGTQPNGGFFGQPDATISTFRRRACIASGRRCMLPCIYTSFQPTTLHVKISFLLCNLFIAMGRRREKKKILSPSHSLSHAAWLLVYLSSFLKPKACRLVGKRLACTGTWVLNFGS